MSLPTLQHSPSTSTALITNKASKIDGQTEAELLVLIQQYLGSKYGEVADKLREAIEKHQILPVRYDFEGNPHPQTVFNFLERFQPYANSLPHMFERLCQLQAKESALPVKGLPIRFFSSRRTALDRRSDEKFLGPPKIQSIISVRPSLNVMQNIHPLKFLQGRQLGRIMPISPKYLFRKELMSKLNRHTRIMGHLSSIFCVAFDRSGQYIFTGADDNLIKVWDVQRCLLRFTFRGHTGEISDLSVSHENSLMASASVDKTVRVWCLRNGGNIHIYKGHSATVNSITFIPLITSSNDWRWLVSSGNNCSVVFHRYNEATKEFLETPTKFNERATGGARIVSSTNSPGGNLVIMGDTHQAIIMYKLADTGYVERLYEFTAHSDRVDTLVWAHRSLRFLSGSKDGAAKSWSMFGGQWKSVELVVPETTIELAGQNVPSQSRKNNNNNYRVTMLSWTLDDDLVISIGSDYLLRTWDWKTGTMLAKYPGHHNDTYLLIAHPLHTDLVLSAGHDGLIIVWDIYTGRQICRHRNENNEREAVAIFDMAISPDGTTIGCVDLVGNLSIYGISGNQDAMIRPHEQFFSTDYRLLQFDQDGRATDDDTGLSPELLTPPFFVTSDGNLHTDKEHRMIPGHDIISDLNDGIKPCAWINRDIVGPLHISVLDKYLTEQKEKCHCEKYELERKFAEIADLEPVFLKPAKALIPTKATPRRRRTAGRSAQLPTGILPQYVENQPRYVLDDQWLSDENDRSFSLGSDEDEEDDYNGRMLITNAHHSDEERETATEERNMEGIGRDEDDENDSDYEVGRAERETVFRERTSYTVTGRRKRRPPAAINEDEQRISQSVHFRSERLRNRALRHQNVDDQLDQQPSTSSTSVPQTSRTMKTRRTVLIASSDGEEANDSPPRKRTRQTKNIRDSTSRDGYSMEIPRKKRQQRKIRTSASNNAYSNLEEEEEAESESTNSSDSDYDYMEANINKEIEEREDDDEKEEDTQAPNTVTQKRKRRPPAAINEDKQRISQSVDFHSERLRNRALRQQNVNDQLDQQPSTSSTSVPQTNRTMKTRRTAFIATSNGEENDSPPRRHTRQSKNIRDSTSREGYSMEIPRKKRLQRKIRTSNKISSASNNAYSNFEEEEEAESESTNSSDSDYMEANIKKKVDEREDDDEEGDDTKALIITQSGRIVRPNKRSLYY